MSYKIKIGDKEFESLERESVLECLLRNGEDASYSCKKGLCESCRLLSDSEHISAIARSAFKFTEDRLSFLACICLPKGDIKVSYPPADKDIQAI
ncbi:MAG: 2Fe-2S iron-sulfur cluster binding domain-containing protein [Cyclobacteriaceae bacterium]